MANVVNPKRNLFLLTSKYWLLSLTDMIDLQDFLMSATFITNIKLLFENPSDYIVSVRLYAPLIYNLLPNDAKSTGNIKVGDVSTGLGSKAFALTNLVQCGIIAEYTFNEYFKSFLDYEPYTKVQIFLPYYDFVDLDINMYMGKTLQIGLNIDLSTGLGMYYFVVDGNVVETYNAQFGIDIPLSNYNANEIARNMLLATLNTTKQIVGVGADYSYKSGLKSTSKNISEYVGATAMQTGIGSVVDFVNTNQKKFSKSSQPSGYLDFTKPQNLFLIISRPNIVIPSNYAHTIGYPSGRYRPLSLLTGFTIVDEVHLENFGTATDDELNEIENLLKSGVIL